MTLMTSIRRCCRAWPALLLLSGWAWPGAARAAESAPGTYVSDGGWGTLEIKPAAAGAGLPFTLEAMGANGHSCSLDGTIRGDRAVLSDDVGQPACVVLFKSTPAAIQVDALDDDPCRYYCGARAGFSGAYLPLPPRCGTKARKSAQQRFLTAYRAKAYAPALAELAPILSECQRSLHWIEAGSLRNDIAITQYHLGQLEDCRRTLVPVLVEATHDEDTLRNQLSPIDFDNFLPIAKAAWFNARRCASPGR